MRKCTEKRKGATLSEMMVVLAVIAVISTIVVSFSLMMNLRVKVAGARLAAAQDLSVIETITESWIDSYMDENATFSIDANGALVANVAGGASGTLKLDKEKLVGIIPDGTPVTCNTKNFNSIIFSFVTKDGDSTVTPGEDAVFFATVTYSIPLANDQIRTYTYVFSVNPHVGEVIPVLQGG